MGVYGAAGAMGTYGAAGVTDTYGAAGATGMYSVARAMSMYAADRSSSQVTRLWWGLNHSSRTRVDPHKTTRFFDLRPPPKYANFAPTFRPRELLQSLSHGDSTLGLEQI